MNAAERPPIVLTEEETIALALRVVIGKIDERDEWFDWEDVPLLDEDGVNRLFDALADVCIGLERKLRRYEQEFDVDSAEIQSRVS